MSTTMRTTTLQTVPESLPADHVTNSVASAPAPAVPETKTHHSTTSSTALKTRSSSSAAKVRTHNFIWAARILAMDTRATVHDIQDAVQSGISFIGHGFCDFVQSNNYYELLIRVVRGFIIERRCSVHVLEHYIFDISVHYSGLEISTYVVDIIGE